MAVSSFQNHPLLQPGKFITGCNYWASHAGTAMWADWRPDIVQADLQQLAGAGLEVLRVFPLWPDFQPIRELTTGAGRPQEIRLGDQPLGDDETGRAGLSAEMLARFGVFLNLAHAQGLKLIVGLLTGWMSGRLFLPPALEKINVLTDPRAILWELRFVRAFVRRFRHHPAVLAWDLGNECNCMAEVPTHAAAAAWTAAISSAIRSEDPTRPIVSGMHSLDEPDENGPWRIADQSEWTDVLTTHPYPIFTPHCDQDPVDTFRPLLHATAQTRWYGDIGATAALAEEVGTLGPMVCSEETAARYLRTVLFSLWAHDCRGLLWWCAYDQGHLDHPPYDWHSYERELGLFRADRRAKPVAQVVEQFQGWLKSLPFQHLPQRTTQAVCILTHGQEQWAAAYGSFLLARQAGFDIEFQYADQPLKPSSLYLVPSVRGGGSFSRRFWLQLQDRVRAGASLYLSHHDCMLSPFNEFFGIEVKTRAKQAGPVTFALRGDPDTQLQCDTPYRLELHNLGADVLAQDQAGNPVFTRHSYGQGQAYFLSMPLETALMNSPGSFHSSTAAPFWKIYAAVASPQVHQRVLQKDNPFLGITEHPLGPDSCLAVLINYSPTALDSSLLCRPGWKWSAALLGSNPEPVQNVLQCHLPSNEAAVWLMKSGNKG